MYFFSLIEIRAELNIFQACIFDFFLFDFNTNNGGTDLDLGTLILFDKDMYSIRLIIHDLKLILSALVHS